MRIQKQKSALKLLELTLAAAGHTHKHTEREDCISYDRLEYVTLTSPKWGISVHVTANRAGVDRASLQSYYSPPRGKFSHARLSSALAQ